MKPGVYGMPDDVVEMAHAPGASRPSCTLGLRRRVVRIAFDGGYRDILLEERQIDTGIYGWVDRIMWPFIWFGLGLSFPTLFAATLCIR